ncbi:MAG: hypothetical protein GY820_31595, partial [Gammaproteobacteria bacterium]|nr:hypothetical protein [Gammaproteobacteria bacterium]
MTDFVFEDDTGYSKYRMKFPKELKAVLDSCYLIVWGWEAQLDLLAAAFEGDPDWSYTKPGGSIKTSVAADWSTLDIAVINRFSEFGKVRTTTAAKFYDTRKNRNLLMVLEGLINDPGLIEGYDNRAKSRVGGWDQNSEVAAGFITPGLMRRESNHPENNIIQIMITQVQGLWYYLIAEIVYHPFWLKTQYQEALDPTQPRA